MENRLFFEDFVRLHILIQAARHATCAEEIGDQLVRRGYRLRPSEVYHLLRAMENDGLVAGSRVSVTEERRVCYEVTGKGRQVVEMARSRLLELADEALGQMPES
jgi:DNA-binding PadR family transcriptional regulator